MAEDDIKVVGLSSSKNKGKVNWKIMGAIIGIVVLSLGIVAGILLVRQQQDLREKASVNRCPGAQQCPSIDNPRLLLNCNPPAIGNIPQESTCRVAGQTSVCGNKNYCCPTAGAAWTEDMTGCETGQQSQTTTGATGTMTCSEGFTENFDGSLDSSKWHKFGDANFTAGQLVIIVPPTGSNNGNSGVSNMKKISGDFAIYFDMPVITKSAAGTSGGMLTLINSAQDKILTVGRKIKPDGTYEINANIASDGKNENKIVASSASDTPSFRVERKSDKISIYYKTTADYVLLNSFNTNLSGELTISFTALSLGNPLPITTVKIDNFSISCPSAATSTATSTSLATATSSSGTKTATPTATSTSTSSSGTGTKTATPRSTSTSSSSSTSAPVPVTGANWPTVVGAGFGVIMLLISLGLAL